MKKGTKFSIVVPVLHEAPVINGLCNHLRNLKQAEESEVILVDGGAEGDTLRAVTAGDILRLVSRPCRAIQMNAGAGMATGDVLIFLHADTRLPDDALTCIDRVLRDPVIVGGAFSLGIDSPRWIYRSIAVLSSLRSRLTRIPYGDQAIFLRRRNFTRLGGFPEIPLMEDVALMRRIRQRKEKIAIIRRAVATSPRRWEKEGVAYVILRNRLLLLAYFLGVPPDTLARYYCQSPSGR